MRQPTRYDVGMKEERCDKTGFCASFPWVYPSDDGKYVLHADYAALQAENERLRNLAKDIYERGNVSINKDDWEFVFQMNAAKEVQP